jgi:hypothetical protein
MLYSAKVRAELERKRGLFTSYHRRHGEELAAYHVALASLGARFPSAAALAAAQASLPTAEDGRPVPLGALASAEYDRWLQQSGGNGVPTLPFGLAFAHHEEARAWAEGIRGVTTIAVDGSQLTPWKDASVPVALIQAGIFENPHQPPVSYLKDVVVEVLGPEELAGIELDVLDARSHDQFGYSEQMVHVRRFELEVETLIGRMRWHAERTPHPATNVVALYDGSLLVSFALKMPPYYRDRYVAAVQRLRATSAECRIPLVGYIDTSYARDAVTMLSSLSGPLPMGGEREKEEPSLLAREKGKGLGSSRGVYDVLLWLDLAWGDRSPAFVSARGDLPRLKSADGGGGDVAFVYFRAALDRPPARLEFPRWVLDADVLDRVIDVVRAEVIAGGGYPYCIEAADAVAVISVADRARFYALFQEFATREGLGFNFSRKAASKSRRRV